MRPAEDIISRITRIVVTGAACIAGGILVFLMFMTTFGVIGRKLGYPINGVFDLTHFTVLTMTFLGMAYCGFHGAHVSIELLYQRLGPATRRILDRGINLVGCVIFLVIAWRTYLQSDLVREINESSQLLEIPYYPFYWLAALGSLMFALVMLLRVFVPEPEREGVISEGGP
ncbi:MAG TPA: TRAP transporter small permease [Alphaproteobacteria bacterium]|nr:TRAP transporter small permease [Alphaproteobacteria bacterium]